MMRRMDPVPGNHGRFVRPDYAGGGLLNLMATLARGAGAECPYPPLAPRFGLGVDELAASRRIVLIVIDGLGDGLLDASVAPTLAALRVGRLTSVFPSTTASAVTTLLTALPPAAHGLTGWHMWFEEIGQTLAVLPLSVRGPKPAGWRREELPPRLFAYAPLSARIGRRAVVLSPREIAGSPFNSFHSRAAETLAYPSSADFFPLLASTLADERPVYVHAYLPDLDTLMHEVGPDDAAVKLMLRRIDRGTKAFLTHLAGSGTIVVVTADHGFLAAPSAHLIELDTHPELAAMLTRPLCGERRVAYAYVKPECHAAFATYVERNLGHACQLFRSRDFVAEGWFGPLPSEPAALQRLFARVGDFVLLMRDDWTIKDWLAEEKRYRQPGVHAGASAAEMWVPLLVARL